MTIINARITDTMLGREDHGIMTFSIGVEFDGGGCCVGGYCLDGGSIKIISQILDVVGVNSWEELKGQYIRFESNGWGSRITKIGNLMYDKWIDFEEFFSNEHPH